MKIQQTKSQLLGQPLLASILISLCSSSSTAHEFWIEASDYAPQIGEVVSLTTWVGENFIGDEVPNIEEFYSDYSVQSKTGRTAVLGSLATDPPAYIKASNSGVYLIGQRTHRSLVELEPEKFVTYLKNKGMEYIIPLLKERDLEGKIAREYFSRCAKALIQADNPGTEQTALLELSKPMKYTLEIIPLSNPASLNSGDSFNFQLLYEGQPRSHAEVIAVNRSNPEETFLVSTNENGMTSIQLTQAGIWMLSSVHMVPIDEPEADWESFWANLTFEID